jgi:3-oxoacyl-[acyl-carrier protein] reductase
MKSVFITGGSRGIGAECVKLFASSGFRVAFTYKNSLDKARDLAAATGALPIYADLVDTESVTGAVKSAIREFGVIDILINNGGMASIKLFTDVSDAEYDEMMAVNLKSAFLTSRLVTPGMILKQYGRIINVSSIWGITGSACEVVYSASKAGLIGMTKAMAKELAPSGITVNCIAPGVIDTDMNASLDGEARKSLCDDIPTGRFGKADEVAKSVFFLASDDAAYITGQVLSPNGGMV